MKHRLLLSIFFSLFVLTTIPGFAQGFLKVSGKKIVDAKGSEIILRGMGLGGWMLQEPYMMQLSGVAANQGDIKRKIEALIGPEKTATFYDAWLANHCTKSDIDSMKAWGFNSVRLPMHYNLYTLPVEEEPVRGQQTWLEKGFRMTDSLLSWCKEAEMYLILDLHAAPGGQGNDIAISDRDTTKPSLWQSRENELKTIALWRKLAERYAGEKWIGAYDVINEPNWGFQSAGDKNGCAETGNAPLKSLMVEITTAIREVDKDHIIIIEGNCWGNNYKGILPTWDNNTVVSFHKYWNDNTTASIQQFLDIRDQYNVPIWLGESGENSNVWYRSAIKLMEQHKIGWAWWPLKKLGMNNPMEMHINPAYQQTIAYWKGEGPKPSAEDAFKGLMLLAEASNAVNTSYQKDVVDAMFRQVKEDKVIPFRQHQIQANNRVYAVDFDLGKIGAAYYSIDSANYWVSNGGKRTQWNKGRVYRNDAVDIEKNRDSLGNGYHVSNMQPTEWLQYSMDANKGVYELQIHVSTTQPAEYELFINGIKKGASIKVPSTGEKWTTVTINNVQLQQGLNQLKLVVKSGTLSLNYFQFNNNKTVRANNKNK